MARSSSGWAPITDATISSPDLSVGRLVTGHVNNRGFDWVPFDCVVGYSEVEDSLQHKDRRNHSGRTEPLAQSLDPGLNARGSDNADLAMGKCRGVIQASTDFDGRERAPMRLAEARITLSVIRAREGDLEGAVDEVSGHSMVTASRCLRS
jgi:hypothetical protein